MSKRVATRVQIHTKAGRVVLEPGDVVPDDLEPLITNPAVFGEDETDSEDGAARAYLETLKVADLKALADEHDLARSGLKAKAGLVDLLLTDGDAIAWAAEQFRAADEG